MSIFRSFLLNIALGLLWLPIIVVHARTTRPESFVVVEATTKTDDVETIGDAADDSCTFINDDKPQKSVIIGTDKKSGLSVYNLLGKRVQTFPDGHFNNVDLRYEFPWNGDDIALISTGNRSTNTIDFYYVPEDGSKVDRLSVGKHDAGLVVYGSCMYRSKRSKKTFVFVTSKDGTVIQWEVRQNPESKEVSLAKAREFDVGTQIEGCVVDDDLGRFYVGEEAVGIWQYGAEPYDGVARKLIDHTGEGGHLVADVEGLTIYRIKDDDGYLLASSQGENSFTVYERKSGNYVGKFQVFYKGRRIEDTDGIDVVSHGLNKSFPSGLLVVQDGNPINIKQSFKYVSWDKLASKFSPPLKRTNKDPIVD